MCLLHGTVAAARLRVFVHLHERVCRYVGGTLACSHRASAAAFVSNRACTLRASLYTRTNTQVRPHAHTHVHAHAEARSLLQLLLGATTSVYTDRRACACGVHPYRYTPTGAPLQVQAGLVLLGPTFWADLLTSLRRQLFLQLPGLTCRSLWGTSASLSLLTFLMLVVAGADWLAAADLH